MSWRTKANWQGTVLSVPRHIESVHTVAIKMKWQSPLLSLSLSFEMSRSHKRQCGKRKKTALIVRTMKRWGRRPHLLQPQVENKKGQGRLTGNLQLPSPPPRESNLQENKKQHQQLQQQMKKKSSHTELRRIKRRNKTWPLPAALSLHYNKVKSKSVSWGPCRYDFDTTQRLKAFYFFFIFSLFLCVDIFHTDRHRPLCECVLTVYTGRNENTQRCRSVGWKWWIWGRERGGGGRN